MIDCGDDSCRVIDCGDDSCRVIDCGDAPDKFKVESDTPTNQLESFEQ